MEQPRQDTRGILDATGMLRRVRFRRRLPAPDLRPYVEHYWLIDWALDEPYEQHVLPHPSVNLVFQRRGDRPPFAELAGVGLGLFSIKLESEGQVRGVQFRPGGFRPFHGEPVAALTGRRVPVEVVDFPGDDAGIAAVLDNRLRELGPRPDPLAEQAMRLVEEVREDRGLRRVDELADRHGLSVRTLQRLFGDYVGVSPKWVILRYRIHEALELAAEADAVDWARLAADLGYSDQAHLVRDFTRTIGLSPTAYRALLR